MGKSGYWLVFLALPAALWATQPPILPAQFSGWQQVQPARLSSDPYKTDQAYGAVLKEYGFLDSTEAAYSRNGQKLTVHAARFADASGAYGAFTFYRRPEMEAADFGDQSVTQDNKVLFFRGNILVQVTLERISGMTGAEMRRLAELLPEPAQGVSRNLPPIAKELPRAQLVAGSEQYIVGPVAMAALGTPAPVELVDFNRGAEMVTGRYAGNNGGSTLAIVAYPTPQMASGILGNYLQAVPFAPGQNLDRAKLAERARSGAPVSFNSATTAGGAAITLRRSGPLLIVISGEMPAGEAQTLAESINYQVDVTWNERTSLGANNPGPLIVGTIILSGIIVAFAIIAGVAFGGFRILMKRLFPDRVFDRPEDMEVIRLNLRD